MAIINGEFETPGARRYDAAGWTQAFLGSKVFAPFGHADPLQVVFGAETFDHFVLLALFAEDDVELAEFDPESPKEVEDFEDLWGTLPATHATDDAPWSLVVGDDLQLRVNGGTVQTVVFQHGDFADFGRVLAEELAGAIDRQLVNADARLSVGNARKAEIITRETGPDATLEIVGGSAAAKLGLDLEIAVGGAERGALYPAIEHVMGVWGEDVGDNHDAERFGTDKTYDVLPDEADKHGRFAFVAAEPFGPPAFLTTHGVLTYTTATELFNDTAGFGTLLVNF
jgi:hypothetical protein